MAALLEGTTAGGGVAVAVVAAALEGSEEGGPTIAAAFVQAVALALKASISALSLDASP